MNVTTPQTGRPADSAGRLEKELRCYDALDALQISYTRVDHPHADTIADCAEIEQALQAPVCKNLFLCNRQKTDFYLLLMPGEKPFRTKHFSSLLGVSRLSFAGPEDLEKYLGLTPGSVTIFGLINDQPPRVKVYVDRPVAEQEFIGCHPCINTSTLRLTTADVLERFVPSTGHTANIIDLPAEI